MRSHLTSSAYLAEGFTATYFLRLLCSSLSFASPLKPDFFTDKLDQQEVKSTASTISDYVVRSSGSAAEV